MSKKDEMIRSANKQLRKLVNIYVIILQKRKRKENRKETNGKKLTILTIVCQATT